MPPAKTKVRKQAKKNAVLENADLLPPSTVLRVQEYLPMGSYFVDYKVLSNGGLPMGQTVEIFSEEDRQCKSATIYWLIGSIQLMYPTKVAILIDTENRFDMKWAQRLGVNTDPSRFRIYMAADIEGASQKIVETINSGLCSGVFLDSVGGAGLAANSDPEKWKKGTPVTVGELPRKLNPMLDALKTAQMKFGTIFVYTNQVRAKIGVTYGDDKSRPGGYKLAGQVVTRLRITLKEKIKASLTPEQLKAGKKPKTIAFDIKVTCFKNSIGGDVPEITTTGDNEHLRIYLDGGLDKAEAYNLYFEGVDLDIIQRKGSIYNWYSPKKKEGSEPWQKIKGETTFIKTLIENDVYRAKLKEHIQIVKARRKSEKN